MPLKRLIYNRILKCVITLLSQFIFITPISQYPWRLKSRFKYSRFYNRYCFIIKFECINSLIWSEIKQYLILITNTIYIPLCFCKKETIAKERTNTQAEKNPHSSVQVVNSYYFKPWRLIRINVNPILKTYMYIRMFNLIP